MLELDPAAQGPKALGVGPIAASVFAEHGGVTGGAFYFWRANQLPDHAAVYVACMTMTEAAVIEVLAWLGEREIAVWLDGGWGVDALAGEQTRDHKDLDLIVRHDHVPRVSDVLHEHGFRLSRGVQGGYVLREERGRVVDVHPVRFDDRGNGRFESEDRAPFDHPAAAFAAAGNIAGRPVSCLSAEAQMTNLAWGYTPADTDFRDMRLLNARLGTALLPPYIT